MSELAWDLWRFWGLRTCYKICGAICSVCLFSWCCKICYLSLAKLAKLWNTSYRVFHINLPTWIAAVYSWSEMNDVRTNNVNMFEYILPIEVFWCQSNQFLLLDNGTRVLLNSSVVPLIVLDGLPMIVRKADIRLSYSDHDARGQQHCFALLPGQFSILHCSGAHAGEPGVVCA